MRALDYITDTEVYRDSSIIIRKLNVHGPFFLRIPEQSLIDMETEPLNIARPKLGCSARLLVKLPVKVVDPSDAGNCKNVRYLLKFS
jgi:hypothetical protein